MSKHKKTAGALTPTAKISCANSLDIQTTTLNNEMNTEIYHEVYM